MNYETSIAAQAAVDADESGPAVPRLSRKFWIGAALVLVALVAIYVYTHRTPAGAADADKKSAQAQTVTVVAPGRTEVAATITASGTIAARREMPVGIAGEGGRVLSVLVDAGAWVRAGQVLAVVDRSVQVEQAAGLAANVEVQRANARLAQSNLDRALKLVSKGFISKADVDRLTATRDSAVAQVRVAEANLAQTRASNARLNIVAPADGLVLSRGIEPGQVVGPGSGVLFRMAKGGELEMQARLAENDLARLSVGQSARVAPVGTDRAFEGQIWQLSPVIDPQTREGTARIALAYDPALRPGGFASASISSGTVTAPVLPESAILSDEKGAYVYVVGPDRKVFRRAVRTGTVTPGGIAVVEGLQGNERVVLRAGGFLNPGDLVNPIAAPAR